MLVGALSTYPIESFSVAMMEDDRLLLKYDEYIDGIREEEVYIRELPLDVYAAVARLAKSDELTARVLRDEVVQSMHTSVSFLFLHTLAPLNKLPWSLVLNDIEAGVHTFLEDDCPEDANQTTKNIWKRGQLDKPGVVLNLTNLRDAPCSAQIVEKSHRHGAILNKYHKRLSPLGLQMRSGLADSKVHFRLTDYERAQKRLWDGMQKELRLGCNQTNAWHVFSGEYCKHAHGAHSLEKRGNGHVFSRAARSYRTLEDDDKLELLRLSDVRQSMVADKKSNEVARKFKELLVLRQSGDALAGSNFSGIPLTMNHMRFTLQEIVDAAALYKHVLDKGLPPSAVIHETECTIPPCQDVCDVIAEVVAANNGERLARLPWWADFMLQHRGHFRRCAIGKRSEEYELPMDIYIYSPAGEASAALCVSKSTP